MNLEEFKASILLDIRAIQGMEELNAGLIDDAIEDFEDYTHRDLVIGAKSVIKDLVIYRFNTLGTLGLKSESFSGNSSKYDTDIPERIKRKLKAFRRLP